MTDIMMPAISLQPVQLPGTFELTPGGRVLYAQPLKGAPDYLAGARLLPVGCDFFTEIKLPETVIGLLRQRFRGFLHTSQATEITVFSVNYHEQLLQLEMLLLRVSEMNGQERTKVIVVQLREAEASVKPRCKVAMKEMAE